MGKPGTFIKRGQARPVTVALRLSRLENMVGLVGSGGGGGGGVVEDDDYYDDGGGVVEDEDYYDSLFSIGYAY